MSELICRRCGEPMRLADPSGTHPWCDPQVWRELGMARQRRVCRRCSGRARLLTDEGLCGWCRDQVAAWQRHRARRSAPAPQGRPAPAIDLARGRSPLRRRQQDAESSLW